MGKKNNKGNYVKLKIGPLSAKIDLDAVGESLGYMLDDQPEMIEDNNTKLIENKKEE